MRGGAPVFVPARSLTTSSFRSARFSSSSSSFAASSFARTTLLPQVSPFSFSARFVRAANTRDRLLRDFDFGLPFLHNYNPCPLHSAGSSHTTYVPRRASELVATAGRSLDYAPSLFHHHPTESLSPLVHRRIRTRDNTYMDTYLFLPPSLSHRPFPPSRPCHPNVSTTESACHSPRSPTLRPFARPRRADGLPSSRLPSNYRPSLPLSLSLALVIHRLSRLLSSH